MVSYFMTQEELLNIYDIFINLYPEESNKFWTKEEALGQYEIAKMQYFDLKLEYNEDGSIRSIRFLSWYGKDTTKYVINMHNATKVNTYKETESFMRSMRGGIQVIWDEPWIYMEFDEISREIESRLVNMDKEEIEKIRKFLEKNREKIDNSFSSYWTKSRWQLMKVIPQDYTWLIEWILKRK